MRFSSFLHAVALAGLVAGHPGEEKRLSPEQIVRRQIAARERHSIARKCAGNIASYNAKRKAKRNLLSDVDSQAILNPEAFVRNTTCIMAPEVTEGPYYINNEIIRMNMVEDQAGIPLTLDIGIIDVTTCEPMENVLVEIWAANATGVYSGYSASMGGPPPKEGEPNTPRPPLPGKPGPRKGGKGAPLRGPNGPGGPRRPDGPGAPLRGHGVPHLKPVDASPRGPDAPEAPLRGPGAPPRKPEDPNAPPRGPDGLDAPPRGPGGPGGPPGGPGGMGSPTMVRNETFLRGGYPTDENGFVELVTVYPGYYQGRTAHIHTMVHLDWEESGNGTLVSHSGSLLHIGQFFFHEAWNDKVYVLEPYTDNPNERTYNDQDDILDEQNADGNNAFVELHLVDEDIMDGVIGFITVGVDPSASYRIQNSNYLNSTES